MVRSRPDQGLGTRDSSRRELSREETGGGAAELEGRKRRLLLPAPGPSDRATRLEGTGTRRRFSRGISRENDSSAWGSGVQIRRRRKQGRGVRMHGPPNDRLRGSLLDDA